MVTNAVFFCYFSPILSRLIWWFNFHSMRSRVDIAKCERSHNQCSGVIIVHQPDHNCTLTQFDSLKNLDPVASQSGILLRILHAWHRALFLRCMCSKSSCVRSHVTHLWHLWWGCCCWGGSQVPQPTCFMAVGEPDYCCCCCSQVPQPTSQSPCLLRRRLGQKRCPGEKRRRKKWRE